MVRELALAAILFVLADPSASRPDARFQVIVHPSNPAVALRRADLSAIFLRRMRSWPDGRGIDPVEPSAPDTVREAFSRAVHGKTAAYVTRYWHRLIFAGRAVPPPSLRSDAAVLEFVRTHRGAVGYVDRNTAVGDGVKVIEVTP